MEEIAITSNIPSEVIDFSLLSLFFRADLIVKSVIIILILASIYSWKIIIGKLILINRLKKLSFEKGNKELVERLDNWESKNSNKIKLRV